MRHKAFYATMFFACLTVLSLISKETAEWVVLGSICGTSASLSTRFLGNYFVVQAAQQFSRRMALTIEKWAWMAAAIVVLLIIPVAFFVF